MHEEMDLVVKCPSVNWVPSVRPSDNGYDQNDEIYSSSVAAIWMATSRRPVLKFVLSRSESYAVRLTK